MKPVKVDGGLKIPMRAEGPPEEPGMIGDGWVFISKKHPDYAAHLERLEGPADAED